VYTDTLENISPDMLNGFFQGWKKPRSKEEHLNILKNSDHIVLAIDIEAHKVVGFITALTDHIQSAFIPLLEILPEYRNQGIGTELVAKMLKKLQGIPAIDLMCDSELQPFYAKFKMVPSVGMIIRNY
jgi:ribosomal protein S18 acetylase RimI-like enzyme